MFGSSKFGENIFGQDEFDHELILPPWKVQCPDEGDWFPIRQHSTTVERCKPDPASEDGGIEFPPVVIP